MKSLKNNISYTLRYDLCTGCGICEGACPSEAITTVIKDGRFLPKIDTSLCRNDKGCHRCLDACPGVGVDLKKIAKENFSEKYIKDDKMVGRYLRCYTGYSNNHDIRYHAASGGMVSQFLMWLLENKYIDGAVVTRFDKENPLLVKSYVATTPEEVWEGRSSKYAPVSLNKAAQDIKTASGNRYVVVGIPCHIEGMRKLMAIDKKLREKVIGLFAIYCSSGRTFYLTEHVFKYRNIKKEELTYFAYRDEGCLGSMVAKQRRGIRVANSNSGTSLYNEDVVYKERFQSYYHPLRSFFIPRRCLFCIDHYGELGDVCFGDIHIEPYIQDKIGVNSLIVRTTFWQHLLEQCEADGAITLSSISVETLNASQTMAYKKKDRNGAFINLMKKMRRSYPVYDVDYLREPTIRDIVDYIQNRCQQFLGNHKSLWCLVNMLKKDTSNLK
ncbi:MAG: Coenzyme F420 hydrogenase/dehydrogenase, beta subunit C-terminal domain [Bacteroidaceae bacterium]|nr:Coenzyme F420 hydrogenase/dehydrogenase, beta subunit C-terminal domain [Bacteroidaceae bacterium]